MSQHDINIANQGFPAFRSDLNNALAALVSNSSGSTAPTTTFAHQFWLDTSTTPNRLRQRNADNDAWIEVGRLDQVADTFQAAAVVDGVYTTGNQTIAGTKTFSAAPVVPGLNGGQLAGMRNKIINGKMEIAQRGTSFVTPVDATYTMDRWSVYEGTDGAITVTQQSDVPADNEFQNSLRVAVTAADTSIAAGQYAFLRQAIEGYNVRDLIGKTFTLSFRVRSSKTGVHCVAFRSSDRSYVLEYTINAANTWESKSVTVSGGLITAGTWNWTNGVGVAVDFAMACGTTFQTTAGAWQTGSFFATSNQVNCLDSNTNIFAITGVQLEVGGVATPFEHRPIGAELALCQRYFCKTFPLATTPAQNVGTDGAIGFVAQAVQVWDAMWRFPVEMRTTPSTVTTFSTNAANGNWSTNTDTPTASIVISGSTGLGIRATTPGAAGRAYSIHATAAAEL